MDLLKISAWLTPDLFDQLKEMEEQKKSGKSVEEIAADRYMALPDHNSIDPFFMVKHTKDIIEDYHKKYDALIDGKSEAEYFAEQLDATVEDMTQEQRCEFYQKMLIALGAFASSCVEKDSKESENAAERFVKESEKFAALPRSSESQEMQLREAVMQAMSDIQDPVSAKLTLPEGTWGSSEKEVLNMVRKILKPGRKSADYKLLLATQIYVNYLDGKYKGENVNLSLDAVVHAVCVSIDQIALDEKKEKKELCLKVLGIIFACAIFISMAAIAILLLFESISVMFGVAWAVVAVVLLIGCIVFGNLEITFADLMKEIAKAVSVAKKAISDKARMIAQKIKDFFKSASNSTVKNNIKFITNEEGENAMENRETFNLNKNLIQNLKESTSDFIERLENGESVEDLALELCLQNTENDEKLSNKLKDEAVRYIERYHDDMEQWEKDKDTEGWLRKALTDKASSCETSKERCDLYHRISLAMDAYRIANNGDENAEEQARAFIEEHSDYTYSELEAEAFEDALLDSAILKIMETDFLLIEMENVLEAIKNSDDNESLDAAIKYGRESKDIKLLLSLQAYFNVRNNHYSDLGRHTPLESIARAVSACVDAGAIAADVASGSDIPFFRVILTMLNAIISLAIGGIVAMWAGLGIASFFAFCPVLHIIAAVVFTAIFAISFVPKIFNELNPKFQKIGSTMDNPISLLTAKIRNLREESKRANRDNDELSDHCPKVFLNTSLKKSRKLPHNLRPTENDIWVQDVHKTSDKA